MGLTVSRPIRPTKETFCTFGSISYNEGNGTWSVVRFKKDFIQEFPVLREKRARFSYDVVLYRNFNQLEKAVRKMKKSREVIPILFYLKKK